MEIPINKNTIPHKAIEQIVDWLGVGYETTITDKRDGSKFVIRIISEEKNAEKEAELKKFRDFYLSNAGGRA
jgi:hypothetical protein